MFTVLFNYGNSNSLEKERQKYFTQLEISQLEIKLVNQNLNVKNAFLVFQSRLQMCWTLALIAHSINPEKSEQNL